MGETDGGYLVMLDYSWLRIKDLFLICKKGIRHLDKIASLSGLYRIPYRIP